MGRLISDRMSYRNHYMCSGEATSLSIKAAVCQSVIECVCLFPNSSETAKSSKLKLLGMISLGIRKVLG